MTTIGRVKLLSFDGFPDLVTTTGSVRLAMSWKREQYLLSFRTEGGSGRQPWWEMKEILFTRQYAIVTQSHTIPSSMMVLAIEALSMMI